MTSLIPISSKDYRPTDSCVSLVDHSQDSVVFARLIDEAIPGICGFLRSAQTSDILEAVSFFVTGEDELTLALGAGGGEG